MISKKYISIPLNEWESEYKPLKERLEEVQEELEKEKRSKSGVLYVRLLTRNFPLYNTDMRIGHIDFSIKDAPKISIEKRKELEDLIVERLFVQRSHAFNIKLATPELLDTSIKKMETLRDETKATEKRIQNKLATLPKIVKWLFKIK